MGYDIFFSKQEAEKIGFSFVKIDEVIVDNSFINSDGFWVEGGTTRVPVYETRLNGKLVHVTNLHVGNQVSWRSSSLIDPQENGGMYDNEPTFLIKSQLKYTESY